MPKHSSVKGPAAVGGERPGRDGRLGVHGTGRVNRTAALGDVWVSRLIIAYMKRMRFSSQLEAVLKAVAI